MCPREALRQKQGSERLQSTSFGSVFAETRRGFLLGLFKLEGRSEHEGSPAGQRRGVPCAVGSVWFRRSGFESPFRVNQFSNQLHSAYFNIMMMFLNYLSLCRC